MIFTPIVLAVLILPDFKALRFHGDSLPSSSDADSSWVVVRFKIGTFLKCFVTFSQTTSNTLAVALSAREVAGKVLPSALTCLLSSASSMGKRISFLLAGSACFCCMKLAAYVQENVHHIGTSLMASWLALFGLRDPDRGYHLLGRLSHPVLWGHWCHHTHIFTAMSSSGLSC